jgi:DNA polymerase zeta
MDMVLPPGELELLQNEVSSESHVTVVERQGAECCSKVSPNGLMYAKQHLRRSLLAKMLTEILETRVMVKQGMKTAKGDKVSMLLASLHSLADTSGTGIATSTERTTAWSQAHGGECLAVSH